ncbi:hypothetical protein OV203_47530 [Nannocystis sp. ILAH1]|uniref:hypothetical protein n=1 Tax=Nannocystis sp. ILAH1 TaxID=2996789 RepID=UPI00226F04DE|nr:hypothetical protein [Nannocystis sp. ILAH1]MCY0994871.1 hypothetical protein [Nannocystis sp. ILAH1]
MIRLPDHELDESTAKALDKYQAEVDRSRSYKKRVELAKERWEQVHRSVKFNPVKSTLARMCCGARRCAYCEDSYADEVEHFRPKDLYPEHVFRWQNYAYTCGPCNGPKGNQFAVFTSSRGKPTLVARGQNDPVKPPAKGPIALIDPRSEDPLEYLWLDLEEFVFTENADEGTRAWHRARYTIDTLGLNKRDELVTARASAYGSFGRASRNTGRARPRGSQLISSTRCATTSVRCITRPCSRRCSASA